MRRRGRRRRGGDEKERRHTIDPIWLSDTPLRLKLPGGMPWRRRNSETVGFRWSEVIQNANWYPRLFVMHGNRSSPRGRG
eukprot:7607547-Pyramimonas_sp.AAC.1